MNETNERECETVAAVTPDTEAPAEATSPKKISVVGISFRSGSKTYFFDPGELRLAVGDSVIVETARGIEFAKVAFGNRPMEVSKVVHPLKKVVRRATEQDIRRNEENRAAEHRARQIGEEKIAKHKLEMKLVDVEYTFDNQKLLFYFTADGRVDFRELVKDLASVFRTRIELRQIGIRDETKMMGGLGVCGRPFCCSSFLTDFVQVSIKMAKEQNFSLNSSKISGSCGRLMCCLRYEHEVYEEALKTTPPVGSLVSTEHGNGYVIEARPLTQMVKVRLEDSTETKTLACDAVTVLSVGKGRRPKPEVKDAEAPKESQAPKETAAEKPAEGKVEEKNRSERHGFHKRRRHHDNRKNGEKKQNSD
ncbi:MAG: stage 0 sporulation protein [Clostridia bacterium]|nr:stage 0 sporulation protein [Clostridia bacterium]